MKVDERGSRRNELLDAAVRVVRRVGPSASMTQLAAEGGVTKPILYRHFGDRDGLVAALGTRFADELFAEIVAALDAGGDPLTMLRRTVDAYLAFVERDPAVYRFLVEGLVNEQPGAAGVVGSFMATITARVSAAVRAQTDALGVPAPPTDAVAHGLVGMVHSVGLWWTSHPEINRSVVVEDLVTMAWSGLSALAQPLETGEH